MKCWDRAGNKVESAAMRFTTQPPPDREPPALQITNPINGTVLHGQAWITVLASDPSGIKEVRFYLDGIQLGSLGAEPHQWPIDCEAHSEGRHWVEVRAYDNCDNQRTAKRYFDIDRDDPPEAEIFPIGTVSGIVTVRGSAWDPDEWDSVEKVEIKVEDGTWYRAAGTNSWSYSLDTKRFENGHYVLYARAYDGSGHGYEAYDFFIIDNPLMLDVSLQSPPSRISADTTIRGSATNAERVEVRIDGSGWRTASGTDQWSCKINVDALDEGIHTLTVRSYARGEYSEEKTMEFFVEKEEGNALMPPELLLPGIILLGIIAASVIAVRR